MSSFSTLAKPLIGFIVTKETTQSSQMLCEAETTNSCPNPDMIGADLCSTTWPRPPAPVSSGIRERTGNPGRTDASTVMQRPVLPGITVRTRSNLRPRPLAEVLAVLALRLRRTLSKAQFAMAFPWSPVSMSKS